MRQQLIYFEMDSAVTALKERLAELEAKEARLILKLQACRKSLKSTRLSFRALSKYSRNL